MQRSFLTKLKTQNGLVLGGTFAPLLSTDLPPGAGTLTVGEQISGGTASDHLLMASTGGTLDESGVTWTPDSGMSVAGNVEITGDLTVDGEVTATKGNFTAPNKDDNALVITSIGASQVADMVVILSPFGGTKARFDAAGTFIIRVHSAPADDSMVAGELAFWFDQTPSAAKLMVKAKDSGGTVVTSSISLT